METNLFDGNEFRGNEVLDFGTVFLSSFIPALREIVITIKGKRLSGTYCLIKMKKSGNEWLFFKKS